MTLLEHAEERGLEVRAPWSRLRRTGSHKVAFSIRELVGLTSDFSLKHATPDCTARVIRTEQTKFLFVYNVTCKESYSDPKGHTVRLKFDLKRLKETGSVDDLDVRVSCSCPAFLYWGAQWNLSTGDALYGAPRDKFQAPTDPERYKFVICKHVKIVSDRVTPVLERMLSGYRDKKDRALQEEKDKQVQVVKQRQDLEVEKKKQELTPKEQEAPTDEQTPITPKPRVEPQDDLDAMPDDLTTIGLPPKPVEAPEPLPQAPKRKVKPKGPIEPKQKAPEPEKPAAPALPSNITLVDDDDDTTTVLPGSKAKRMIVDEEDGDFEPIPRKDKVEVGSKAKRMVTPKPGKPKGLPPNIKLIDDDTDDQFTKINRLKQAALLGALSLVAEG